MTRPRDCRPGERPDPQYVRRFRHDCEARGCFNDTDRCKLGMIDHLFPGNNGAMDIDAYCHMDGRLLFIEWKGEGADIEGLNPATRRALRALSHAATVIVAKGDCQRMLPAAWYAVEKGRVIARSGRLSPAVSFDQFVKAWAEDASRYVEGRTKDRAAAKCTD